MADIKKVTPLGSSTTYDLIAKGLWVSGGRVSTANTAHAAADYGKMYYLLSSSAMNDSGTKPKFSVTSAAPSAQDGFILDFH